MKHPGIEALFQIDEPWSHEHCELAERLFPGSHARMNPGVGTMHSMHHRNERHSLGCLPCMGLGGLGAQEPAWYKNPFWVLVGVGALYYAMTR